MPRQFNSRHRIPGQAIGTVQRTPKGSLVIQLVRVPPEDSCKVFRTPVGLKTVSGVEMVYWKPMPIWAHFAIINRA